MQNFIIYYIQLFLFTILIKYYLKNQKFQKNKHKKQCKKITKPNSSTKVNQKDTPIGQPVSYLVILKKKTKTPQFQFPDLEINLQSSGNYTNPKKMENTDKPTECQKDTLTSSPIYLYLKKMVSLYPLLGIKLQDYGTQEPEQPPKNSTVTPKKFSLVLSLLITDKSYLLVPINKSSYGTPQLKKNTNLKPKTTKIGYLVQDIPLSQNPPKVLNKLLTSPPQDGMEDQKSGTPTFKLKTLSKLTKLTSTLYPSPLTVNTLLPVVKIKNYTFGTPKTQTPTLGNQKLDPLSSKSPSTLNYNGLPLVLNTVLKSGIQCPPPLKPQLPQSLNYPQLKEKKVKNKFKLKYPCVFPQLGTLQVKNYSLVSPMVTSLFGKSKEVNDLPEYYLHILNYLIYQTFQLFKFSERTYSQLKFYLRKALISDCLVFTQGGRMRQFQLFIGFQLTQKSTLNKKIFFQQSYSLKFYIYYKKQLLQSQIKKVLKQYSKFYTNFQIQKKFIKIIIYYYLFTVQNIIIYNFIQQQNQYFQILQVIIILFVKSQLFDSQDTIKRQKIKNFLNPNIAHRKSHNNTISQYNNIYQQHNHNKTNITTTINTPQQNSHNFFVSDAKSTQNLNSTYQDSRNIHPSQQNIYMKQQIQQNKEQQNIESNQQQFTKFFNFMCNNNTQTNNTVSNHTTCMIQNQNQSQNALKKKYSQQSMLNAQISPPKTTKANKKNEGAQSTIFSKNDRKYLLASKSPQSKTAKKIQLPSYKKLNLVLSQNLINSNFNFKSCSLSNNFIYSNGNSKSSGNVQKFKDIMNKVLLCDTKNAGASQKNIEKQKSSQNTQNPQTNNTIATNQQFDDAINKSLEKKFNFQPNNNKQKNQENGLNYYQEDEQNQLTSYQQIESSSQNNNNSNSNSNQVCSLQVSPKGNLSSMKIQQLLNNVIQSPKIQQQNQNQSSKQSTSKSLNFKKNSSFQQQKFGNIKKQQDKNQNKRVNLQKNNYFVDKKFQSVQSIFQNTIKSNNNQTYSNLKSTSTKNINNKNNNSAFFITKLIQDKQNQQLQQQGNLGRGKQMNLSCTNLKSLIKSPSQKQQQQQKVHNAIKLTPFQQQLLKNSLMKQQKQQQLQDLQQNQEQIQEEEDQEKEISSQSNINTKDQIEKQKYQQTTQQFTEQSQGYAYNQQQEQQQSIQQQQDNQNQTYQKDFFTLFKRVEKILDRQASKEKIILQENKELKNQVLILNEQLQQVKHVLSVDQQQLQ